MNDRFIPISSVPEYVSEKTGGVIKRTVKTVREWASKGLIRSKKVVGSVLVDLDSVDKLLEGEEQNAGDIDGR